MPDEWSCPQCGVHNPLTAKFCGGCGAAAPPTGAQPAEVIAAGVMPEDKPPGEQVYIGRPQTPTAMAAPTGERKYNNFGLYAIILGILALICCGPVSGIPGIVMAKMQLDAIRNGQSPAEQHTMAVAGFWASIGGTVLGACFMLVGLLMMMMRGM